MQESLGICFQAAFSTQQAGASAHPMGVVSALDFMGKYARALTGQADLLNSVKQFLAAAFQVPTTVDAASQAFRYVCQACVGQLAVDPGLDELIALITRSTFGAGNATSAIPAVEGIMPIILQSAAEHRVSRVQALVLPLITIFRQVTEANIANKQLSVIVLASVSILARIIKYMDNMEPPVSASSPFG
jgi:hypothetical protein